MHILIAIASLIFGLAIWYSRLKMLGSAAKDIGRAAQRVKNAPRKFSFMHRAGQTGLKSVRDPMEAGSILMVLMAGGHGGRAIAPDQQRVMQAQANAVFELDDADSEDLITHAVWMVRDVDLVSGVVLRMTQVIKQAPGMGAAELIDMYEMLEAVGMVWDKPSDEQARILELYRSKVGLSV